MIHRYRDSIIILGIILALSLTGANGISFSGTTGNEAFQATVDADIDDVAVVNYATGNLHFAGSGNANYAKTYKIGTTLSKVGIKIRGADEFEGDIGGRRDIRNRLTSAYLDVNAVGFNFLDAYGSSAAGSVKSGVDLEVVNGDANFAIGTWADGKNMKTVSSLATGDGNFIQGGEIEASGYFTGCKGELGTYIEEGYLEDYELSLASSKNDGCFAYQSADWALGDHMDFWAETKKTSSGITKEMDGYIEVYDGAIEDYEAYISDGESYLLAQGFDYASADDLYTDIYYMQLSKAGKLVAEADSYMETGNVEDYFAGAGDTGVLQGFETVDSEYFWMNNNQKEIKKGVTKNTRSSLYAYDVYAEDLMGASGIDGADTGSVILAERVEADYIDVSNRYDDNLKKNGGYGRVGAEMWGDSDISALTDYIGIASYKTATGEKLVSAQGHVDNQYGHVDSDDRTNGYDSEDFNTGNGFDNYFYGKEVSASPWESTLLVGHQLDELETIQQAIDIIPADVIDDDAYGNIFLLEKTYNENNIVNDNNGYERSFSLLGASYYLPFCDENTVIDADTTADGVGDGRILALYSDTANRDFYFENIDFNNGNAGAAEGGAISIFGDDTWHSDVDVNNCDFTNNYAYFGGAIHIDGGELDITNSNFYSNTAEYSGAAIESDDGTTYVSDSKFEDGYVVDSNGYGGAITNNEGYLSTEDVSFIDNGAPHGGAVAVVGSVGDAAQYYSHDDVFDQNYALGGGAIYQNVNTYVDVASGTFTDNEAFTIGGGAVLIDQTLGAATYNDDAATTYSGNIPDNIRIIP